MGVEDIHFALPFDLLKNGLEKHGLEFLNGNSKFFLVDIDRHKFPSTGFSKGQMRRFSETAELIASKQAKSESMNSFVTWVSHVSNFYDSGRCYYQDLDFPETYGGTYSIYRNDSVLLEYSHLAKVRVFEIAIEYCEMEVARLGEVDLQWHQNYWRDGIERLKDLDSSNGNFALRYQRHCLDYHCKDLASFKLWKFDACFDRFYNDLHGVIKIWNEATRLNLSIFITRF